MMNSEYVHGYDVRESTRQQIQASPLADLLHAATSYTTESHVLEAECSVGTLPKTRRYTAHVLAMALLFSACATPNSNPQPSTRQSAAAADTASVPSILVFTKTSGWRHSSIPFGIRAIERLGAEHGFTAEFTEDGADFSEERLRPYRAVVFLNTTEDVLNSEQQAAFEQYIRAGGGFVGVHAAADTEYEWPWYGELVGAWFESHPNNPNVRTGTVDVVDREHPATTHLPERWERDDEWYNYRSFYPGIKVLAQIDEETYEGGTNGSYHPIAWYHEYDGGRAFYTGLGHTDESYGEPLFLDHLLGGIRYAMGNGNPLD